MVKYYGRAKQRTGSVNTNQIGLNMSGCVSRVGRTGTLAKSVSMRSKCNVKFCGDVYYQGQLWATNEGACVEKAPRTQSFNSGVGHSAFPAFKCGATCTADEFREAKKKVTIPPIYDEEFELEQDLDVDEFEFEIEPTGPPGTGGSIPWPGGSGPGSGP